MIEKHGGANSMRLMISGHWSIPILVYLLMPALSFSQEAWPETKQRLIERGL